MKPKRRSTIHVFTADLRRQLAKDHCNFFLSFLPFISAGDCFALKAFCGTLAEARHATSLLWMLFWQIHTIWLITNSHLGRQLVCNDFALFFIYFELNSKLKHKYFSNSGQFFHLTGQILPNSNFCWKNCWKSNHLAKNDWKEMSNSQHKQIDI